MVLPIFYELGWELEVNGEEQEIINTNGGMIGFEMPSGDVEISLKFEQPFFKITILLSIVGLGSLVFVVYKKKYKNKED